MCSLKSCNDNGSRLTLVVAICVEIQDHYSSVSLLVQSLGGEVLALLLFSASGRFSHSFPVF